MVEIPLWFFCVIAIPLALFAYLVGWFLTAAIVRRLFDWVLGSEVDNREAAIAFMGFWPVLFLLVILIIAIVFLFGNVIRWMHDRI